MILYYTGTGNSAYVGKKIAEKTGDEALNLFGRIRSHDYSAIRSDKPFVFAVPTYGWQIPRIVRDWIEQTTFEGSREAYFVMTCGGDNGNAGKYLEKLCAKKGFRYMGCAEIVMPENYVAMFPVPGKKEALEIIAHAEPVIAKTAERIMEGQPLAEKKAGFGGRLSSSLVNAVFYPVFVHAKKFYATDACVGCGRCSKVCPMDNIKLVNGKPQWSDHCTHCMACICRCPEKAIEYGKKSQGKPRYQCPAK